MSSKRTFRPLMAVAAVAVLAIAPFNAIAEEPANDDKAGAVLKVAEHDEYGKYLTDRAGRAVYLLEQDPANESTCYAECASAWPPVIAPEGEVKAGDEAVQKDMLGTVERKDGSRQVTYNKRPLYYYYKDAGPDNVTGQDVHDTWGEWYLVTPNGKALEHHEEGEKKES